MKNNKIEERFVDAVNAYSKMQNTKMKKLGLTAFIPEVEYLKQEGNTLLFAFSQHHFPDHTPHRHLFFFEEFKQNAQYIAFGGNSNYNDVYVVSKETQKVLTFSEEEQFLYDCADSFESFLEAFILLIELEIRLGSEKKDQIDSRAVLDAIVEAAGGEQYRSFYQFIFPVNPRSREVVGA